ncbi:hypothetical protein [Mucilaginibacter polytrichastri]|uniref:Uncharacterized protein n=1 Tax=Mucilaginibacter polytrichastri TaxID=1302689 RepID=A0A1Q6A3A5_9SPHI|nr:hypothetical protein [Mucilaginibacter polytrichastri]OKS88495.1 hypothetical protein RG47T_3964 [Mucilaginibacter polytrichastri]SFT12053.1 hypothetical protein SAMN04487890_111126 [Mucilaginibacter polytrichastri]
MTDNTNNTPDGTKHFTMSYAERELDCTVEKDGNILHLHIDNNINADLEIQQDGSLIQTSGPELPPSNIDFIRKNVLGQDATGSIVATPSE